MTASRSGFGALLRTWRDRLSPADAGFTAAGSRRAPGLRREELAQLAGLSVDYVLRLEQGRAKNPSAQVVGALARALQLSRAERDQLYRGAGLLPSRDGTVSTHVPPGIQRLAARLSDIPVGVFAADWTLVWWNTMWTALHGDPAALLVWAFAVTVSDSSGESMAGVIPLLATAPTSLVFLWLPDHPAMLVAAVLFGALVNAAVIGWCARALRRGNRPDPAS